MVQLLLGLWSVLDNDRLSTAAIRQLHAVEDNAAGRGGRGDGGGAPGWTLARRNRRLNGKLIATVVATTTTAVALAPSWSTRRHPFHHVVLLEVLWDGRRR